MSRYYGDKVLLSDEQIKEFIKSQGWIFDSPTKETDLMCQFKTECKAQLKAVIEWLEQPCREHEVDEFDKEQLMEYIDFKLVMIESGSKLAKDKHREYPAFGWFYKHRKDCPECWAELKGEINLWVIH